LTLGAQLPENHPARRGQRPALTVVNDQWGAPTRAALIADVTAHAVMRLLRDPQADSLAGVYHLAAQGSTSWHGYAQLAVAHAHACGLKLQVTPASVQPIPAASYPTRAARPANSRLTPASCAALLASTCRHGKMACAPWWPSWPPRPC
jgi:dTDP-4-dehydrorhamnose reductase